MALSLVSMLGWAVAKMLFLVQVRLGCNKNYTTQKCVLDLVSFVQLFYLSTTNQVELYFKVGLFYVYLGCNKIVLFCTLSACFS